MVRSRPIRVAQDAGLHSSGDLRWSHNGPDLPALLARILALRESVRTSARTLLRDWRPALVSRAYRSSASNLAAYVGLRRHDLRPIQRTLASLGLSSLGRCEGHVNATLDALTITLKRLAGMRVALRRMSGAARAMARDHVLLRRHGNRLLGDPPAHRGTRFMVTLPSEAAHNYALVQEAVRHGMDLARINCAHDAPKQWLAMVRNVRRAATELNRSCRIVVDLPGPKLRTGPVRTGKALLRVRVRRDAEGKVLAAAHIDLVAAREADGGRAATDAASPVRVSVAADWLDRIRPGDTIRFADLRGRERRWVADKRLSPGVMRVRADRSAYLAEGTALEHIAKGTARTAQSEPAPGAVCTIGALPAPPLDIRVEVGDALLLTRGMQPGEPAQRTRRGKLIVSAHVPCSEPAVFPALRVGQQVWIDDGRVGAVIETLDEQGAWLAVTHARPGGESIRPGKGLNFPDTTLPLSPLSEADLADLDFAVEHADIVGFSFVRSAADIDLLSRELSRRGRSDMGVIAKIETRAAVSNLPEIIVHGAGRGPFGVMIARGDLAVEIGYERLAQVQEEVLWLCEAAHVPVVWATQVLENLVKRGRPSRAEMTDAAMSGRAECVMLNKGPYLFHALDVLDNVVTRMQGMQSKKTAQFAPRLW